MRVVVIGLGSVGSQALWQLARTPGVEAIGLEQFGLGHGYGSFTGESRLYRAAYHEGPEYVPLLRRARELWLELGGATGRELLLETGFLTIGRGDAPSFGRAVASVEAGGVPHERLDERHLRERYPQFTVRDGESGLLDLLGGVLRPELGVLTALDEARRLGAEAREHERVLDVRAAGDGVVVETERGRVEADRAILAGGSWSRLLAPRLEPLVRPRRNPLLWFAPGAGVDPASFAVGRFPAFFLDRPGEDAYGAPTLDGTTVKVSPHGERPPLEVERPEELDRRLDPADVTAFGARVNAAIPGLRPEPLRYSVHHDGYTADGTPVIDRPDGGPIVLAAGFSGHGYKLAPAFGEVVAQLATEGAAPLHEARFTLAAHGA